MMLLVGQGAARLPTLPSAAGAVGAALLGSGFIVAQGESAFEFVFFAVTMGRESLGGRLAAAHRESEARRGAWCARRALTVERERGGDWPWWRSGPVCRL